MLWLGQTRSVVSNTNTNQTCCFPISWRKARQNSGRWCSCNIKHWAGSDWWKDAKRATINRAKNTACSEATNSPAIVRLLLSERPEPQEPPTKGSTEITSSRQMSLHGSVSIDSSSVAAAANDQNWASRNAAVQNIRISRLDEFNIYLNLCVSLSLNNDNTKKILSRSAQPRPNAAKTLH